MAVLVIALSIVVWKIKYVAVKSTEGSVADQNDAYIVIDSGHGFWP
jgi:hypothetical protein